jgi:hypothetical protein
MNKAMAAQGRRTGARKKIRPLKNRGPGSVIALGFAVLCLYGCKTKPDPIPQDTHQPLNNPLVGVWRAGDLCYYFREDGTGGTAVAPDAAPDAALNAAPDDYSFLFWRGQGLGVAASAGVNHLITIGGDTSSAAAAVVTRYTFVENGDGSVTLTPRGGDSLNLSRVSGAGKPLALGNPFIGEWHALWNGAHGDENTWSFKFREDGTLRAYHHGMHQFDNGYLVRGSVMALLGEWRFDGSFDLKYMTFAAQEDGSVTAREESADGAEGLSWDFRRVNTAVWK